MARNRPRPVDDRDRDVLGRPILNLSLGVHARDASRVHRQRISSGHPYEERFGYSRAIVAGRNVYVSGTVANMPDGSDPPADAYAQARRALEIVVGALAEAGARPDDVVRTRMFVTKPEDFEAVGRAHNEVFGATKPATSGLVVQLLDPRWLVEIEAEAVLE
jgi:enamine deaminase RidA (YjgF/YER057c/UK114 family)